MSVNIDLSLIDSLHFVSLLTQSIVSRHLVHYLLRGSRDYKRL